MKKLTPEQAKANQLKATRNWQKNHRDEVLVHRKNWYQAHGRQRQLNRKKQLHAYYTELKQFYKCMNPTCPYHVDPLDECCLDFHHLKDKKFGLAQAGQRKKEDIIAEVKKCTMLCAICHRKVTHKKLEVSHFPTCETDQFNHLL